VTALAPVVAIEPRIRRDAVTAVSRVTISVVLA
jgi:hypothetical protein